MKQNLTTSDIYDVNKKTGGLILGKNRLDDYAIKYLTQHCKEALETPMPIPVEKILADSKLEIKEITLSKNLDIFGCCLLLDGEVDVVDCETGDIKPEFFKAGTVLIDPAYAERYGDGAKRNTLIHEALHWEKDKTYFEILRLKNRDASEKLSPIMCRQSEVFYEPPEGKKTKANEVRWLEWQAHRLAPRILMPRDMFKKKALELISAGTSDLQSQYGCDLLIEELSEFFKVSRSSAKYRLLEVGLDEKLKEFADYEAIYAENIDYQTLTVQEAFRLLNADNELREWITGGHFIYADGYFVLANPKYVMLEDGIPHITASGKKNLKRCVINIRSHKFTDYKYIQKDLRHLAYLCKTTEVDVDKRIYFFDPKFQGNFESLDPSESYAAVCENLQGYDIEEEKELIKLLSNPDTTLCDCLTFLFNRRKWSYSSTFAEATELHVNYFGDIKNNKRNNMGTDMLMAICVGLKLSLRITEKVFEKSDNKLNYYQDPDKTYIHILERFPGLPIADFNSILLAAGLNELGTQSKK